MADRTSFGMVSYYNPLVAYRQQEQSSQQTLSSHPANQGTHAQAQQAHQQQGSTAVVDGGVPQQYWYGYAHGPSAHHQPSGSQQYFDHAEVLSGWPAHPHAHHYSHLQYQHHQGYQQQHLHNHHQSSQHSSAGEWRRDQTNPRVGPGEPSPPMTASGSEISTSSSPPTNNLQNHGNGTPLRPGQIRSPYEWMKKPSYQNQPHPGKTRTKDKYRVVYTDHQRLELEKEFHFSRYITIRRKAELAAHLRLSERQVKIWFQNRRAKERKQVKKLESEEMIDQQDTKATDALTNGMSMLGGGIGGILGGNMPELEEMRELRELGELREDASSPPGPENQESTPLSLTLNQANVALEQNGHQNSILGL